MELKVSLPNGLTCHCMLYTLTFGKSLVIVNEIVTDSLSNPMTLLNTGRTVGGTKKKKGCHLLSK